MNQATQSFTARLQPAANGGALVVLPFDPTQVWGARDRYHVTGTIAGQKVRGPLRLQDNDYTLPVGPSWLRDCPIVPDTDVDIVLALEGPQLDALDADIAAALAAEPEAQRFFESLAQFYRKAYLTWLAGAKRRPEVRAQRLQEFIELLKAGKKSR